MKRCVVCYEEKPFDEFSPDQSKKDKHVSTCKPCASARARAWAKANPDKRRERQHRWREAHPERVRDFQRKWDYGLAPGEYQRMLDAQGGACYICRRIPKTRLHVDHNHRTGEVRALLCQACNFALGFLKDNPLWLEHAATYLRLFDHQESDSSTGS